MKTNPTRCVVIGLLSCAVCLLSSVALAVPARILTNTGRIAEGSLTGISPVIRLNSPGDATFSTSPAQHFDIPLSSILQITLDFPRIVVETERRVLVGPFSAFRGIDEVLKLERAGVTVALPLTTLRAIALNGNPLRPVPRTWLGDGYLSMPEIAAASLMGSATPVGGADGDESVPIWGLSPTVPPVEEQTALPWWAGMLIVAAVVVLFVLASRAQGS